MAAKKQRGCHGRECFDCHHTGKETPYLVPTGSFLRLVIWSMACLNLRSFRRKMSRKWTATRELPSSARLQFPGIGHESDVGKFPVCLSRLVQQNAGITTRRRVSHRNNMRNVCYLRVNDVRVDVIRRVGSRREEEMSVVISNSALELPKQISISWARKNCAHYLSNTLLEPPLETCPLCARCVLAEKFWECCSRQ